jgi:copper chaperone CopZ
MRRTDEHSLQLAKFRSKELDPATAHRNALIANHKKGHTFRQQFLDAVAVTAGRGVILLELRLQFANQGSGFGRIRSLGSNGGSHGQQEGEQPNRTNSIVLFLNFQFPRGRTPNFAGLRFGELCLASLFKLKKSHMKNVLIAAVVGLSLCLSARAAEVSTTLSHVHLCCQSCVKGVQKAVASVEGAKATVDEDAGTVVLTGANKATVQKAADALVAAGYFGHSSSGDIKVTAPGGAKGAKVQSLKLEGVHLCCGKCVSAVDKAVKSVAGVKEHTAKKNAESFEVTGDFKDKEVLEALHKAGLTGRIAH